MRNIPSFAYRLLWQERVLRSVANLTRRDGAEFMTIAALIPIQISVQPFRSPKPNAALSRLRAGQVDGAAVLRVAP